MSIISTEFTFSIFLSSSSRGSNSLSSDHPNEAIIAFSPNAIGSSSNLVGQFVIFPTCFFISSNATSGEVGMSLIFTAIVPIFYSDLGDL